MHSLHLESSALMASSGMLRMYSRESSPRSCSSAARMALMRSVLVCARPPERMAVSTAPALQGAPHCRMCRHACWRWDVSCCTVPSTPSGASRTACQVGKASFRLLKARMLFTSVVFCERMVRTLHAVQG